ncbi:MAG TPA: MFS transporter [Frankiaceae bacterium]|nr:MFS transporter [Frankiaceae bacterium]
MSQAHEDKYVPPPPARRGASVLRLRDFRWLWIGQTVSSIGDQIFPIAVALKVVHAGGSAGDLGVVLLGRTVAMVLFVLVGGVYADRISRTRVMIGADVLRAVAVGGLALVPGDVPVSVLALLTFVVGGGEAFFRPAYGAIVPSVVPKEMFEQANAFTSVSLRTAAILGPALGGFLVAVAGTGWALTVDAATFGISMLTLLRIAEPPPATRLEPTTPLRDALEGVAAVRARPWVGAVLVMATLHLMLAIAPMMVLMPFIARERLGGDDAYGLLLVVFAVGGLAGTPIGGKLSPRLPGQWGLLGLLPHAGLLLSLAYSDSLLVNAAWSFAAGVGLEPFAIWWSSALQRDVPPALLARVISLDWLASLGLMPLGLAFAGPAAEAFGREPVLVAGAVALVVSTLAVLPVRGVREFATPTAPSPG